MERWAHCYEFISFEPSLCVLIFKQEMPHLGSSAAGFWLTRGLQALFWNIV